MRDSNDVKYDILDIASKYSKEDKAEVLKLLLELRMKIVREILYQFESTINSVKRDNGIIFGDALVCKSSEVK